MERSPKRRRTGLWLGLLAVVAIGAGVAVAVTTDDEEAVPVVTTTTLDGADALATWQAVIDEIDFDSGPSGSGGELAVCPFGDLDEWSTNAPESLSDPLEDVADGDEYIEVFLSNLESDDQYLLQCLYYDERTETQIGLVVTKRLDMDYREEVLELLPDFDIRFDPDRAYAGGTLVSYCADVGSDTDLLPFCEADWYDDDVLITLFYSDEEATSDEAVAWLEASLPDWLEDVGDADLDDLDVTTVTY